MRVILLTHGGADLVIERLAQLDGVELAAVFIESPRSPKRSAFEKLRRSLRYDGVGGTVGKLIGPSRASQASDPDATREAASRYGVPVTEFANFHDAASFEQMRSADADLGVVYGTNIIRESVFAIPRLGSINLHQGLAPYYRGGPPVFWELFNNEKEVGLTVHFVAAKVDTGDIVLQTARPLEYDPGFGLDFEAFIEKFRTSLREDSANLVAQAVSKIAAADFERIAQDTSLGRRYRLPIKKEKDEMRRRLKQRLAGGANG